ncbi:hypothetical protein ERD78_03010 [Allopusillimonas soli]|uniref:DUF3311 domain-containing protein n=1 Tax=Allopusillimonas soli TaxID=659016 RepID=A0A853F7N3_9BURK|nr:hypothetical protein [Allopusillimonas soli]NYT35828.1 hypothetical protein [Allopusillimonas soli]TEA76198.1 hypothetical protein ERD78_03010 [Allopusillimonas soli]
MDMRSNAFERKWFYIFMFMYVFIMIPFPFYFNTEYVPGWLGVPIFVYGWIAHGIVVLLLILLFAHQCLKRPEYRDFDDNQTNGKQP